MSSTTKPNGKRSTAIKNPTGRKRTPTPRLSLAARKPQVDAASIKIVNYTTGMRWLNSLVNYERMRIVPRDSQLSGLTRMRRLLKLLGDPHQQVKCVQVAGTKGKGSTCAMMAHMLGACGYTVGLYASPHLVDLRERITVDGQMITHADMADLLKQIASQQQVFGDQLPTFFEVLTAVALRHFADQAVDIAVLETGLGGRLDATTIVQPLVCGMTHISLDHMNILGHNLTEIAREKAGIFKKEIPTISVAQEPEVAQVFDEVAEQTLTPLEYTGQQIEFSYRFEASRELGPHTRVSITTPTSRWEHLAVPLPGEHQAHNCGLALSLLDKLKAYDFDLPEDKVIEGLARTVLPGRMEQVWPAPRVLVDGAHNAASIYALIKTLGAHIAYDSLVMIFGCGQNKDILGMLRQLSLGADKVIFTTSQSNPRSVAPEDLLASFGELSAKMAQTAPTLQQALTLAGHAVSREDLIVITGSFYLAGEAKKHFASRMAKSRKK